MSEPLVNNQIRDREVLVIDENGNRLGKYITYDALRLASDRGFDLIAVSFNTTSNLRICKFGDYGKFKYEAKKKASEIAKQNKKLEEKEIQLRPNTAEHDINKQITNNIISFLKDGHRVKVVVKFRGREISHEHLGKEKLELIINNVIAASVGKIEVAPKFFPESKAMHMILIPI